MHITVLGSGLVGNAIIKDLVQEQEYQITVVDKNLQSLNKIKQEIQVKVIQENLEKLENFSSLLADTDLVVCAVPGFMGYSTLKKIIEAGKNVVDISFFSEDPFQLDALAKSKGITAVVDCGVAPGLCNIIVGYADKELDQIEKYICYVGGLPQARQLPYEYKAVFSPIDVIEEYTRPSRFIEHGKEVIRPALSEIEQIDFPNVGTLEAFNTDGLRSLIHTLNIPFMKEKTLRFPGHARLMQTFRESGFFNTTPIQMGKTEVKPIDLTSKLLFDQWKLKDGEEDFTVFRVIIEGKKDKKRVRHTYDLFDKFDKKNKITSMARTTGYTCTIIVRQLINRLFTKKGICPPEFIGETEGCYDNLLDEYNKRNIKVTKEVIKF